MRIAFWGNFGTNNLGNECTLAAALHNFQQRFPQAELVSISVVPEDTKRRHAVTRALPAWKWSDDGGPRGGAVRQFAAKIRRRLKWIGAADFDALVVPGTGILNRYDKPFALPWSLFKWALVTRLRGGKVLFVSVGIEDTAHPLTRFFINRAFGLASYRSFRDARSLELARRGGCRGRCVVAPDLAFSLPASLARQPAATASGKVVAVGVFNYRYMGRDLSGGAEDISPYRRYVEKIGDLVVRLINDGHTVRLIVGDVGALQDLSVREDVRSHLQETGFDLTRPEYIDEPALTYQQVIEQIGAVDYVIASRFHNVVLALFLGRPVLALSYEGKIRMLMENVGLGDYCGTLADFDVDRVMALFHRLQDDAPALRDSIRRKALEFRQALDEQYGTVAAMLSGRDA